MPHLALPLRERLSRLSGEPDGAMEIFRGHRIE
jgi:hypothetical protein